MCIQPLIRYLEVTGFSLFIKQAKNSPTVCGFNFVDLFYLYFEKGIVNFENSTTS